MKCLSIKFIRVFIITSEDINILRKRGTIMEENINALDEISKGASMGIDAISFVLDKVEDNDFKDLLEKQRDKYKNISEKIKSVYKKYNSEDKPHETNTMTKLMTWYGVEIKTLTNHSNSKIAELLIQGTDMGIIEGRKIYNNKKIDKEVLDIVNKFIEMQENSIEELKNYL